MPESIHETLKRRRKPRVHLTYEVWTGDAKEKIELPFVVGVLADLFGNAPDAAKKKAYKDRAFIEINKENFSEVMKRIGPGAQFRVDNKLANDGTELGVQLKFESIADFEPGNVAKQVPALASLLETREKLRELQARADINDDLEKLMQQVLTSTEDMQRLSGELGGGAGTGGTDSDNKPEGGE